MYHFSLYTDIIITESTGSNLLKWKKKKKTLFALRCSFLALMYTKRKHFFIFDTIGYRKLDWKNVLPIKYAMRKWSPRAGCNVLQYPHELLQGILLKAYLPKSDEFSDEPFYARQSLLFANFWCACVAGGRWSKTENMLFLMEFDKNTT